MKPILFFGLLALTICGSTMAAMGCIYKANWLIVSGGSLIAYVLVAILSLHKSS